MNPSVSPTSSKSHAAVHAVVIGIDKYPYLPGGQEYAAGRRAKFSFEMGQLTSPAKSARSFVDWLRKDHHLGIPLSLQVLVTDPHRPDEIQPTCNNIMRALEKWRDDCDADPGNVGILFWIGHGFEMGNGGPWALAEDYGADRAWPFENMVSISAIKDATTCTRARTFCYLVDCCRTSGHKSEVNQFLDDEGRAHREHWARKLPYPAGRLPSEEKEWFGMYSVPQGHQALALPAEDSFFTEAVLRAFKGTAATTKGEPPLKWKVTTERMKEGIVKAFEYAHSLDHSRGNLPSPAVIPNPYSGGDPESLHIYKESQWPHIPFQIDCYPDEATPIAKMCALHTQLPEAKFQKTPNLPALHFEGPVGRYTVDAEFEEADPFHSNREDQTFRPPLGIHTIEVERRK